jgi:hypothetical protein
MGGLHSLLVEDFIDIRRDVNRLLHTFYQSPPTLSAARKITEALELPHHSTHPLCEVLTRLQHTKPRRTIAEQRGKANAELSLNIPHYYGTHPVIAAKVGLELARMASVEEYTPDIIDAILFHDGVLENGHYLDARKQSYNTQAFKEERLMLERLTPLGYVAPVVLTPPLDLDGKERKVATPIQVVRMQDIRLHVAHLADRLTNTPDTDFQYDELDLRAREKAYKGQKWVPQRFTAAAQFSIEVLGDESRDDIRDRMHVLRAPMLQALDDVRKARGVSDELHYGCLDILKNTMRASSDAIHDAIDRNFAAFDITTPRRSQPVKAQYSLFSSDATERQMAGGD